MDRGAVLRTYGEAARWRRANPDAPRGLLVGQAAPRNPSHGFASCSQTCQKLF